MGKSREKTRGRRDFLLFRGNLRGVVILLALAAALVRPNPDPLRMAVGMGVVALGCLIHLLIKGQLIRNVVICNEGFYGVVRHPYYFANFVIDSGFCVLSGSEILLFFFPFLFFWAYGPALNNEEKHLEDVHGQAYRDFRAIVPQMLPSTGSWKMIPQILANFRITRISSQELKRLVRIASTSALLAFVNTAGTLPLQTLKSWPPAPGPHRIAAIFGGLTVFFFLLALCIPRKHRPVDAPDPSSAGIVSEKQPEAGTKN